MGANADVVKAAWEAFGKRDIETATSVAAESAEIVVPDSLPWGGTYKGPDGFKQMIGQVLGNFEEFAPEPQAFLEAEDDHVVVPVGGRARSKAGNELEIHGVWLYKVSGGKVVRAEIFADTAKMVKALG